jgi:hypothetical protein
MTREEELLVEKTLTSYRRRDLEGNVQPSPAWADLSAENRRVAFDEAVKLRRMEAALDRRGLSSTSKAVLDRIRGGQR